MIATLQHCWAQQAVRVNLSRHFGCYWLKLDRFQTPNVSHQGGQTQTASCAQRCCDILRCNVAIVWLELNAIHNSLYYFRWNVFKKFVMVIN